MAKEQRFIEHINGMQYFPRELNAALKDGWVCVADTLRLQDNGFCSVLVERDTAEPDKADAVLGALVRSMPPMWTLKQNGGGWFVSRFDGDHCGWWPSPEEALRAALKETK